LEINQGCTTVHGQPIIKMSLGIFLSRLFIGDPWGDGTTFQIISCYL